MSPRVVGGLERLGLILLGVALERLSSPPGPAPWLVLAGDAPFLLLLWHRGGERWKRWAYGYGVARYAAALYWLGQVGWFQYVGAVLLLSLTWLVWGAVLRWLVKRGAPYVLSVGVTAVFQEMGQAYLLVTGGMPWPARSLAFTASENLTASASVFGAYGLSFLAAIASAWVSGLLSLVRAAPAERPRLLARLGRTGAVIALLGLLAWWRGGIRVASVEDRIASGACITTKPLVVVQGNVPQSMKHSAVPGDSQRILERHERLTRQELERLLDHRTPALAVLWPETMVPWPFPDARLARRFPERWQDEFTVVERLREAATPPGATTRYLLGVNRYFEGASGRHDEFYDHDSADSLVFVDVALVPKDAPVPDDADPAWRPPWELANGVHDKRVLVPFGEYTPFVRWFSVLKKIKEEATGIPELTPGSSDAKPFLLDFAPPEKPGAQTRTVTAGTIICFEIAYPSACRDWRRRGAAVLLNAGNYGWFGDTRMPYEVLALARLRAAECAATVVVAGNTGPSAIVDPAGRVRTLLDVGGRRHYVEGVVSGPLYADPDWRTAYVLWGDIPWFCAGLVVLGLAVLPRSRRRGKAPSPETPGSGVADATPDGGAS